MLPSSRLLPLTTPILSTLGRRSFVTVKVTEGDKQVVVEGVVDESPRKKYLLDFDKIKKATLPRTLSKEDNAIQGKTCPSEHCHPLCRLPFVDQIKFTDVLILDQFLDGNGQIIPRTVTGLCDRQHRRIEKLIKMAQKSGLFPNKDAFAQEKAAESWCRNNAYWDENTIDLQYHNLQRKMKRKKFFAFVK